MTDSVIVFPPGWRLTDGNGFPVLGGSLVFKEAGTDTPLDVYSDYGLTSTLGDVVYLNSEGQCVASEGSDTTVAVYIGTDPYKVEAYDADGVLVPGVTLDALKGAFLSPDYVPWTEHLITDNRTVINTEDHYHFNYTGTGGHTVTLTDPTTFGSMFSVKITNNSTTRNLKVSPSGYTRKNAAGTTVTYFWVWSGTTATITNVNGAWAVEYNYRYQTLDNLTLYVDHAAGSNSNDGRASSSAFATIQFAINMIEAEIDALLHGPTIQVADNTFTESSVVATKRLTGNHVITIVGNTTTPGNCIWQCASGTNCITARDTGMLIMRGFRFQQASGSGATLVSCSQHGIVDLGVKVEFGNVAGGYHISAVNGGSVGYETASVITITGTTYAGHWYVSTESNLLCSGVTTYSLAAATFTAFLQMEGGSCTLSGFAFTGAGAAVGSTGAPYSVAGAYDLVGFWNGVGGGGSSGVKLPGNGTSWEYRYPQARASGVISVLGQSGYEYTVALFSSGGYVQFGNAATDIKMLSSGTNLLWVAGQFGYGAGTGGTVTQLTSKTTGVTLSKANGKITMQAGDNIAALTSAAFVLTNTLIEANDRLILNHVGGGTLGKYMLNARCAAGSATINVYNVTVGGLAEAVEIGFTLIKGATT